MNPRAWLLAALLASPAWAQEPAPTGSQTSPQTALALDLRSDAVRKIIRDTAATQYANFHETVPEPAPSEPDEFAYVPPEKSPEDAAPRQDPAEPPAPEGFVSKTISFVIDELIGVEGSEVEVANDLLRCRVQKETKTSPPGVDSCASVD